MSQMHHPCHQFLHRNRTSNRDCWVVQESEFLVREAPASLQMARQDTSHVVCYFYLYCPDWSYKNNVCIMIPSFLPYHWDTEWKTLLLLVAPASQPLNACFTAYVGCKGFVLIA